MHEPPAIADSSDEDPQDTTTMSMQVQATGKDRRFFFAQNIVFSFRIDQTTMKSVATVTTEFPTIASTSTWRGRLGEQSTIPVRLNTPKE